MVLKLPFARTKCPPVTIQSNDRSESEREDSESNDGSESRRSQRRYDEAIYIWWRCIAQLLYLVTNVNVRDARRLRYYFEINFEFQVTFVTIKEMVLYRGFEGCCAYALELSIILV